MITRPILISAFLLISLLSTRFFPREHMPITGWRLSKNIVDTRDGVSDVQRDEWIQDILISNALSEYFDYRGEEIDLTKQPYCYSVSDDGVATVIECPIEAP